MPSTVLAIANCLAVAVALWTALDTVRVAY